MERKTEESVVNRSLGFAVELEQAPMRRIRGEWVLDVGPQRFQQTVLWKLIVNPAPLSGDHVRFMRLNLEKTMKALASHLGVSAAAVSKWEDKQEQPTQMNKGTEVLLRLFAAETLLDESGLSANQQDSVFHRVYEKVSQFDRTREPVSICVTPDELQLAENHPAHLPFDLAENVSKQGTNEIRA